jgi:hypothetical protein
MLSLSLFGFSDVGLTVWAVAAVTLVILILALVAASAYVFFRSVAHFDDDVREATMDFDPAARRRFYEIYDSLKPRDPAVAWFLAVGLGPAGVNFYRGKALPCVAAILSLNGLGAWWLESMFTAPQFVLIENRALIASTLYMMDQEARRGAREPHETREQNDVRDASRAAA